MSKSRSIVLQLACGVLIGASLGLGAVTPTAAEYGKGVQTIIVRTTQAGASATNRLTSVGSIIRTKSEALVPTK